jgi:uncharacterized tellurite resistance protein B-like protein
MLLDRIKRWLLDVPGAAAKARDPAAIATAGLLAEAAAMDGTFDAAEHDTILGLLGQRFALSPAEARELLAFARGQQEEADRVFKFALAARNAFDEEERVELMEMLWATVLADGVIHDFEANLMRRIAGLLHVPDRAAGEARKRALQKLAGRGPAEGDEA